MTEPLLNSTDYARFKAKEEAWFLGAVGDTIRDFCGWHIYPLISRVNVETRVGNKGIIMLPTLHLVSVEELRVDESTGGTWQAFTAGYIEMYGWRSRGRAVSVDFTHGFETMPKAVAEVGYELVGRTMEQPSGIATDITRGPTRIKFAEFGSVLSDDQKSRLGPYTIVRV